MKARLKYIVAMLFVMVLAGCSTSDNYGENNEVSTVDTTNTADNKDDSVEEQSDYMDNFNIGYDAEYSGDYETAVFNYELAIDKYVSNENNEILLSDIEGHLGDCYYILGEYNTAIKHYENTISALDSNANKDYMEYFLVCEGLGDSYLAMSDYSMSKYYYTEALKYYDMADDKY